MAQDLSERPGDLESVTMISDRPETADAELRWAARSAHASLEGCEGLGLVMVENGSVVSIVHTSESARQLDWMQGQIGDGPGLVAIRQLQVFSVPDLAAPGPWPQFGRVALALGIRSGLFVPVVERGRALGALSFYSGEKHAFDGREELALSFSAEVGKVFTASDR